MEDQIIGTEVLGYHLEGFFYVLSGKRLFQVDHNFFLELMPGNEVYGSKVRKLRKMPPVGDRELRERLQYLLKTVNGLL